MADYSKVRPIPPSVFRRMAADLRRLALRAVEDRHPLVRPSPEELQRQLDAMPVPQELDAHGSPIPKGLTEAEKQAALDPGLGPPLEVDMDLKPGWKTTEFWTHVLMTYVVLPLLGFFANQAISPLGDMLSALASSNVILGAVVVALKPALFAALAWAMAQLQKNYTAQRSAVKISHHSLRIAQLKAA